MSKPVSGDFRKVSAPPEGEPWVWLTRDLLASPAWRARSQHCGRLIDFLLIEHLNHAGRENGNLAAPYAQLVEFGLGRRFISGAIREGEALGLIEVKRGGKKNLVADHISRYRLTFLCEKRRDSTTRSYYWVAPSNDWKKTTQAAASAIRDKRPKEKRILSAPRVNSPSSPHVNSFDAPRVIRAQTEQASREFTTREHPSISWPNTLSVEGGELSDSERESMRLIADFLSEQVPQISTRKGRVR